MWMALALPVVELVEEVFLNTPGVCLRKQVAEDGSRELHDVPVARLRGSAVVAHASLLVENEPASVVYSLRRQQVDFPLSFLTGSVWDTGAAPVMVTCINKVRVTIAVESTDSGEDLVEVSNLRGAWTSTGSLPEPLQGYIRSCQLLLAPIVSEILMCYRTPSIETEDIFLGSLEILFIEGWMLEEIRTLDDHGSPRVQNLFDVTLAIHRCLILPPSVFESSPCRVLGNRLQAAKLPHHSRQEICGGPRMAYEWDFVKIRAPKGYGSGWHPRSSPFKAPRWYFAKKI
ncbi:hypothetical protein CRG98_013789 [Punica granatum]|uniref:Uncharacterized protein n=1 Tax=Punica granatum TaxID=22663 RepID=A0A2I0KBE6_PUNGR|nr:hypothetical protein CRG98_013789 [Punica granatum]